MNREESTIEAPGGELPGEVLQLDSPDGTRLRGLRCEPDGAPRGDLLLVHGLAEHLGRYVHVLEHLTAAGWRVTAFELRGHGESAGLRGHVGDWSDYVADLRTAAAVIDGPHRIVAHSTGCLVTLDHLRDLGRRGHGEGGGGPVHPSGAFLTGPLLGARVQSRVLELGVRLVARLFPELLVGGGFDPRRVCRDPDVVAAYRNDPYVFERVSLGWIREMLHATARVHLAAPDMRFPLAVHYGGADQVVSTGSIEAFLEVYGGPLESRCWPGLYHELFNEPERAEVLATLDAWLEG